MKPNSNRIKRPHIMTEVEEGKDGVFLEGKTSSGMASIEWKTSQQCFMVSTLIYWVRALNESKSEQSTYDDIYRQLDKDGKISGENKRNIDVEDVVSILFFSLTLSRVCITFCVCRKLHVSQLNWSTTLLIQQRFPRF